MAILTYPLNGILYDAEDVETYLCTRTSGVFASDGHFPASVTGSRQVTIGPGLAWMNNEEFHGKAIYNPENVALEIAEADAYQTRIDRIVLRFDKLLNKTDLMVLQGTPANSPKAPDIERDSLVYDLGLYTVTVKNSTASISASNISSTMLDESVCGIMEDAVTSIPTQELYDRWYAWFADMQADTATMENQFNIWFEQLKEEADTYMTETRSSFEVWMNGSKVDFDTWFDSIQDTLDGDTAGKLTNLVNDAQDTADEALEQLITGKVTGFMTEEYEGGEYGLLSDDSDDTHAITLSKNICDCEGNPSANTDMISDEFNENHVYSEGDYCIYEDTLFVFTADKAAGAWDWNCVRETNVGTELAIQSSGLSTVSKEVAGALTWTDISSHISWNSSYSFKYIKAVATDNFVYIAFQVQAANSSEVVYGIIDEGYRPTSQNAFGFCNCLSTSYDLGKTVCAWITTDGQIRIWANSAFNDGERFTYMYPLEEGVNITPQGMPDDDDGDTKTAPGPEIIDPGDDGDDNPDDDSKEAPGPEIIDPDDDTDDNDGDDTNVGTLEPGEVIPDDNEPDDDGDDDTVIGPGPEEVE